MQRIDGQQVLSKHIGVKNVSASFINGRNTLDTLAQQAGAVWQYDAQRLMGVDSGVISDIVGGYDIELINLIPDGNFAVDSNGDGLADGWGTSGGTVATLVDNIQTFTVNGANKYLIKYLNSIIQLGRRYYFYIRCRSSTTGKRLQAILNGGQGSVNYTDAGNFQPLSILVQSGDAPADCYVQLLDTNASNWQPIQVEKVFILEVPTTWGTDTEAIKKWLDSIMPAQIAAGYFTTRRVKNDAVMNGFAVTRLSGGRNFDKRILKLRNMMGQYGEMIDINGDGVAEEFTVYGSNLLSVSNGIQKFSPTRQYGSINMAAKEFQIDHKFYLACFVLSTSNQTNMRVTGFDGSGLSVYHTGGGSFEIISTLQEKKNELPLNAKIQSGLSSEWSEIQLKKWFLFDITADFEDGEYPEPTKEDIDIMIQDWIDALSGYFPDSPNPNLLRPSVFFDGADDNGILIAVETLDVTQAPLAVFATIRPEADALYIFAKNLTYDSIQYAIRHQVSQFIAALNSSTFSSPSDSVPVKQWRNIGFIWDGSTVKLFVNQSQRGNTSAFTEQLVSRPNVKIGCRGNTSTPIAGFFKGDIATITVYTGTKANEVNILKEEARISRRYITGGE